ncbi:MAG: hypothetical protein CL609_21880 [Anaerolineaceae bacterium]|nr:hypothetical protein [Anaerolineaceae bacterium]
MLTKPQINLLRNHINIKKVPFSDRGSRLMVFQYENEDQLYIKLAERLSFLDPALEAYLDRAPFITNLEFVDENGNALHFSTTSYPHVVYFTTQLGDFGMVFANKRTLSIGLPPEKKLGIRFQVSPLYWKITTDGGLFKAIRNFAYNTNAEMVHHTINPEAGGYSVDLIVKSGADSVITLTVDSIDPHHEPQAFSISHTAAEQRWKSWFEHVPAVEEKYCRTYAYAWWVMANNLLSPLGKITYESMMPSKINYVGLWLWDSAMHALAFRHTDPELARNQIRAMIESQLPDGMLPDAIYDEGVIAEIDHPIRAEVTKPPILAWAALKLHETDPDLEFLKEIYIPLVRWNAWWFSMNDDNVNGLVQYNHPYSSGLDNNPLWDYGMPVESPDINTYLCVQMGSLAVIAETLGMDSEGAMWRRRASAIVQRMLDVFWDEEKGVFQAFHNDQPIPVLTPFNLYPLWSGQLPTHINQRLVDHLTNPEEFWGKYALPSVAFNDEHYDSQSMWRGPVWVNINYFFIEALRQVGYDEIADQLQNKTLELIMQQPSIYEYYTAETGLPPKKSAEIFGWSAAVFIDLAIQASKPKPGQKAPDLNKKEPKNNGD